MTSNQTSNTEEEIAMPKDVMSAEDASRLLEAAHDVDPQTGHVVEQLLDGQRLGQALDSGASSEAR